MGITAAEAAALQQNLARNKNPSSEDQQLRRLEAAVQLKPNDAAATAALSALRKRLGIPSNPPSLAAPKKPRGKPERAEQLEVALRLDAWFGDHFWCHIPNERSSPKQRHDLYEEGVKGGVPDNVIFKRTPCGKPGFAFEMKAPERAVKGDDYAACSEAQRAWLWMLCEQGWIVGCFYSAASALAAVERVYFGGVQ